jgi:hypothetical protein
MEFWYGQEDRLHERFQYTLEGNAGWSEFWRLKGKLVVRTGRVLIYLHVPPGPAVVATTPADSAPN